jgi:hypothetical protein
VLQPIIELIPARESDTLAQLVAELQSKTLTKGFAP